MKVLFELIHLINLLCHIPEESRPALFAILQGAGLIMLTIGFYWLVKQASS